MQTYGTSMNAGTQVVMSAAIGGTAEALGGGKFANGAVTGAYVMMFNHLGWGRKRQRTEPSKLDLRTASPDEVLEHIFKVGQWANGDEISIEEYFEGGGFYTGEGTFKVFGDVVYDFQFSGSGTIDFGSVNVRGGDGTVHLPFFNVYADGSLGTYDLSGTTKNWYIINVQGRGNSFTWYSYNALKSKDLMAGFDHLHGFRLSLFLTYRFTGQYRSFP